MILVPTPLDKYDNRVLPIPLWVSIIRVPAGIEVSMGIRGYPWLFDYFFCAKNNFSLITKKLQLINIHT